MARRKRTVSNLAFDLLEFVRICVRGRCSSTRKLLQRVLKPAKRINAAQAASIRAYVGRQAVVLRDELAAAPGVPGAPNAAAGAAERR